MKIAHALAELRRDSAFMANLTAWETLPSHPARMADIPTDLHPALAQALRTRGIPRLYSHQEEALRLALGGESVAVVTPTASGKTLCYTLPVLHSLLDDPEATALFLFPTKALAHDQLAEIDRWSADLCAGAASDFGPAGASAFGDSAETGPGHERPRAPLEAHCFDGDTPSAKRRGIRECARLILTNPDMLHAAMLPHHGGWERFLSGLRYVVVDEMHTYRGVFGSHVANVFRRLRRIAAHYGASPRFLLASATIANPKQLAESLTERPVHLVNKSGAPQGEKHILLYAPPLYDPVQGLRRSSVLEAQELATRFLKQGLQTIVFGRARLTVELLLNYIRENARREAAAGRPAAGNRSSHPSSYTVRGYRGGYLPDERRQIERGLRSGEVRCVVTTNALELGIDIGQLEAALICGYPGTVASAWQQWGRVGRSTGASVAVLVATAGALDQYVVNHPEFLLQRSPEHAYIDPDNLLLLVDQLRCAAFELPFCEGERFGGSPFTADVLALLVEEESLRKIGARYFWCGEGYPSRRFGLRSAGGDPIAVLAGSRRSLPSPGRERKGADAHEPSGFASSADFTLIGEVDRASAPLLIHDGAVYHHEGRRFLVEDLRLESGKAWVWPADVDYYTEASTETEIQVLSVKESRAAGGAGLGHGEILVTSQVTQYRRVRLFTHENLGAFPLDYPPTTLDTAGYWFEIAPEVLLLLKEAGDWRDAPVDYGPDWQERRANTRARDRYCCAECGAPESDGRQHDVHHRTPFRAFGYIPGLNRNDREANRLDNLVLLCRRCHQRREAGVRARTGMDGAAYALGNIAPLHLMCDRRDIDVAVVREERVPAAAANESPPNSHSYLPRPPHDSGTAGAFADPAQARTAPSGPRIYIYERIPAGIGFSAQLYERHEELIAGAIRLISDCRCRYGCPACVGPVLLVGAEQAADHPPGPAEAACEPRPVLDTKRLALALLNALTGCG